MYWLLLLAAALLVSYLIGSVNFALITSKIFARKDVREMGSGNAGMTNVIRTVGLLPGIITFLGDFLKGIAAPLIGYYFFFPKIHDSAPTCIANYLTPYFGLYLCGILCIIGHAYPVFFGFRGGKGVSTAIAVLYCIDPFVASAVLITFLILFLITKIISIGSIMGAAEFTIYNFLVSLNKGYSVSEFIYLTVLSLVITVIIICKHKDNIVRLREGTEKKLSSHK